MTFNDITFLLCSIGIGVLICNRLCHDIHLFLKLQK
jgi:hypothetical protein